MVLAELSCGAEKIRTKLGDTKFARRVDSLRQQLEVEPLGETLPGTCGGSAAPGIWGRKCGDRDTIIAAHALSLDAGMVTRNVDEFDRVRD